MWIEVDDTCPGNKSWLNLNKVERIVPAKTVNGYYLELYLNGALYYTHKEFSSLIQLENYIITISKEK